MAGGRASAPKAVAQVRNHSDRPQGLLAPTHSNRQHLNPSRFPIAETATAFPVLTRIATAVSVQVATSLSLSLLLISNVQQALTLLVLLCVRMVASLWILWPTCTTRSPTNTKGLSLSPRTILTAVHPSNRLHLQTNISSLSSSSHPLYNSSPLNARAATHL